ncbi:MAG: DNA translocase FtsK, partial [Clostridia bacterium]|nr:DNA translocase FtsK [Clostridia bacterium]
PPYVFPPVTLLKVDPAPPSGDVRAELQQNAEKLVETLSSFNVRTKIVNVSRGPTITRYELQPEAGTRVRSIANLVDDIALNLATTGVRIEAPIPGKAAVGIEVPNKVVATVYARELIESEAFQSAKSRLTACLGRDVAGAPIYCDLAKMPHLLIAGTTGSGKSVCINSIMLSILYKASPDEVKLILIDPKKVELNVYNGIPHLLVPVVSDPKKAAGSLNWAVGEMERRYELIEDAGVRNLQGYNAYIESHPERGEKLHQIVIVIDELADLMMTAKDDVETSICRIAQKARAAGMHLVIGTQRPSVDVITGLIKANVPSRIAFTTVSQVDSRTIIDIAGAEKLIGRGDMLYSPVGSTRPVRVQGAFVSDSEVESVIDFIKNNSGEGEYSEEVIESIEKEAARCGQSKKGGGSSLEDIEAEAADEPADPMLRPAIELAIECGKISTSLIQRRLSLGYGRAAKLIDRMERLGYVSAPDGQKPRDVLITRQQFMEMVVRDEDLG